MQIVENKALVVETDAPDSITSFIPRSKAVTHDKVVVAWGLNEARALAKLGRRDTPSPILRDYNWPGKFTPFDHQKTTASFFTLYDKAFCFSEAGTSKTAAAIWAADYLMNIGEVRRVLVLCPLSIMRAVWQQDLFTFAMHRSCGIAHGTAKQRTNVVRSGAEFVIINFDGLGTVEEEVIRGGFDLVIVDEATAYKTTTTVRWKTLNRVMQHVQRLWMMTGTPAAQSPLDAFGLARLVNPDNTPRSIMHFRDSVMLRVSQFTWVAKPTASQTVHTILQPAIRFEKKDCLDLPPVVHMERDAPLTLQQQQYYDLLKSKLVIQAAGETVTALNAATGLQKLMQIAGGAVYSDDGEVIEFDVSNRINVVIEAIEQTENKVLVFVPFTHTIRLLKEALLKHGIPTEVIDGSVSMNERTRIVDEFQKQQNPRVLIIQPQAAAHGLTLTAADTIVWYAPVPSVETYLQANARIDRPGQKNNMTIVHISGSDVERRLYKLLRSNLSNHQAIIDLYMEAMKA
jgi:SNF2 family DNA or RNA helicase